MINFSAIDFIKNFEENTYVVVRADTISIAYKSEDVRTNTTTLEFVSEGEEVVIPFDANTNVGECDVKTTTNGDKTNYSFSFMDQNGYEWKFFTDALEALEESKNYIL